MRNRYIRELPGGLQAAQTYWQRILKGGATPKISGYPGTMVDLPGGGTAGFRTVMSSSPNTAATIDVNLPGVGNVKLKFNP